MKTGNLKLASGETLRYGVAIVSLHNNSQSPQQWSLHWKFEIETLRYDVAIVTIVSLPGIL